MGLAGRGSAGPHHYEQEKTEHNREPGRAQAKGLQECQEAGLAGGGGVARQGLDIWKFKRDPVQPGLSVDFWPWGPRKQVWGARAEPCKADALTHEAGDEHSRDPLLPHLLDLGLVTRGDGGAHDSECIHVGDRAHRGGREPGQPEEPTEPSQGADQKQVQVEAGAFEQPPRLLADDEPARRGREVGLSSWLARQAGGRDRVAGEGRAELSTGPASSFFQVPKLKFSHLSNFEPNPHSVDI